MSNKSVDSLLNLDLEGNLTLDTVKKILMSFPKLSDAMRRSIEELAPAAGYSPDAYAGIALGTAIAVRLAQAMDTKSTGKLSLLLMMRLAGVAVRYQEAVGEDWPEEIGAEKAG